MEISSLIVDLQQRLAALLQEDTVQPPESTEVGAKAEVLEKFRSWYREVSLTC